MNTLAADAVRIHRAACVLPFPAMGQWLLPVPPEALRKYKESLMKRASRKVFFILHATLGFTEGVEYAGVIYLHK